jgi:predicted RNA methylase
MSLLLPGLEGYAKRDESLGQWDTHPEVCAAFVRWCAPRPRSSVLEPCAGIGNLARAFDREGHVVTAIEIDPERAAVSGARVGDFLAEAAPPRPSFDLAAMNPPYERDGETRFMQRGLLFAPRVCAIVRLVALASERRADAWEAMIVSRLAHLVPRPVFAGSSGMDEIVFVEVKPRRGAKPLRESIVRMEWLRWKELA